MPSLRALCQSWVDNALSVDCNPRRAEVGFLIAASFSWWFSGINNIVLAGLLGDWLPADDKPG
jgi:hypothetical protein